MNTPRPKVRLSRALGIPLAPKCVQYFERRPYPPGEHGRKRRKDSDYSTRLKEKQRLRAQYDISETQLRAAFDRAKRSGGKTGEALIQDLESRLDATVLRAGFARTIYQARQFVTHQHVLVNGKRVDRPPTGCAPATSSRRREVEAQGAVPGGRLRGARRRARLPPGAPGRPDRPCPADTGPGRGAGRLRGAAGGGVLLPVMHLGLPSSRRGSGATGFVVRDGGTRCA